MDESFVGHEAKFSLRCDDSVVPLLMSFVEELLMVGGSDVEAPEQVERQIRNAIDKICSQHGGPADAPSADPDSSVRGDLQATLSIVGEGVEVRLSSLRGGGELPAILVREE